MIYNKKIPHVSESPPATAAHHHFDPICQPGLVTDHKITTKAFISLTSPLVSQLAGAGEAAKSPVETTEESARHSSGFKRMLSSRFQAFPDFYFSELAVIVHKLNKRNIGFFA